MHTSSIRHLHTKHQHKSRVIRPRQIIANQPADLFSFRHEPQPKRARQIGNQEDQGEQAPPVLKAVVKVHAEEDRERDEHAVRDLH